ncbi:MAG: hypothetical protein IT373_11980 [Polyangiaceae bacterium]|nr:hypothetical protein [Polyangiaceae bacterium]
MSKTKRTTTRPSTTKSTTKPTQAVEWSTRLGDALARVVEAAREEPDAPADPSDRARAMLFGLYTAIAYARLGEHEAAALHALGMIHVPARPMAGNRDQRERAAVRCALTARRCFGAARNIVSEWERNPSHDLARKLFAAAHEGAVASYTSERLATASPGDVAEAKDRLAWRRGTLRALRRYRAANPVAQEGAAS